MVTVLNISSILKGKIPYRKQASLEIEFSGTHNDEGMIVEITLDNHTLLSQPLITEVTKFIYMVDDEPGDHELQIHLKGVPQGSQLRIHKILIEGLNMRMTMEHSGTCVMNNVAHVPSEYMGQIGYQSLKFSTPIYPWLFENEQHDRYYL